MNTDLLDKNRGKILVSGAIFLSYIVLHLVFQRHELLAYDMYTYTSFAEHYSQNWFYTQIPGQAYGLEIVSYPPLLFQFMALLNLIPLLNLTTIYILLMSAAVTALSFSFYRLIRALTGVEDEKGIWLIVLIAFSPGLLKFSLVHGQLPLITGMIFGSMGARFFYSAVRGGGSRIRLAISLMLTGYIHHFSLLITVIMIGCISLLHFRETVNRIQYLIPPIGISAVTVLTGLYPLVKESLFGISQGVIYHGSRYPLESLTVFNQYLTTTYGATILGLLVILKKRERYRTVNILALVFLTLGMGLTTPTAEILFGSFSTFLVYDKFALISSLLLTGIIGSYLSQRNISVRNKKIKRYLILLFIAVSLLTVFWANQTHLGAYTGYGGYNSSQQTTAIEYLNKNASDDYLYQTAGHGTPIGEIRRSTDIPSLDTGYFQGRKHGILKDEGKFDRLNNNDFRQVVEKADNVSLKYVLVFKDRYNSVFTSTDWRKKQLENNVTLWINPETPRYEPDMGKKRVLYGLMPFATVIVSAIVLLSGRARIRVESIFDRLTVLLEDLGEHGTRERILILFFPALAAAPSFLTSGYPAGIDTPAHIFKVELMGQMIREYGRIFYWTDQWYNGYPFLSMYSPVSTNLVYSVKTLTDSITASYNLIRLLTITALSASMYLLSSNITEGRRVRIITAGLAVFSYPIYSNLYTVGRLASALALPVYVFLIHLLLREDVLQKGISRTHFLVGITAGILFLTHSMMAYLFIFTGLIFCWVYRDRVVQIGLRPAFVVVAVPLLMALPYLIRFLQHSAVTDPSWYVAPRSFSIFKHLKPEFSIIPPTYAGLIHTVFFSVGILKSGARKSRFFRFSALNFVFFFTAYWARNYKIAYFIPLSRQFDLARFEITFIIFGILIAGYGLNFIFNSYLSGTEEYKKNLVSGIFLILIILQAAPMLNQSTNWEPAFSDEIDRVEFNESYRAMGVNMRNWHTYLLWEMDVMNTFGWFNQANPNPRFTRYLQRSGGRWQGWDFVQDIEDRDFRKNLLELSNTKYVVSAEGEWMKESQKQQVKGAEPLYHRLNQDLTDEIQSSDSFSLKFSSDHLKVFRFERDMSYCEGVKPVWISEDYSRKSLDLLKESRMLPEIPVKGDGTGEENDVARTVSCKKENPYTVSVDVEDEGWVLVKESYYPFWERADQERIYSGFGFMVTYVEDEASLNYRPRNINTLVPEN